MFTYHLFCVYWRVGPTADAVVAFLRPRCGRRRTPLLLHLPQARALRLGQGRIGAGAGRDDRAGREAARRRYGESAIVAMMMMITIIIMSLVRRHARCHPHRVVWLVIRAPSRMLVCALHTHTHIQLRIRASTHPSSACARRSALACRRNSAAVVAVLAVAAVLVAAENVSRICQPMKEIQFGRRINRFTGGEPREHGSR